VVEIILALTPYWEERKLPVAICTGISDYFTVFSLAVFFVKHLG